MDSIEEVRVSHLAASQSPPVQQRLEPHEASLPHQLQHQHLTHHTTIHAIGSYASTEPFPNVNSIRARINTAIQRFKSKRKKPIRNDPHNETWRGTITVALRVRNSDVTHVGVVLFDPQCEDDTISTQFAEKFGQDFRDVPRTHYADTVTNHPIHSVGHMEARWSAYNPQSQGPSFSPMFYDADFIVIDSTRFDVIIGRRTINELHLFGRNNALVAAFRHKIEEVDDAAEKAKIKAEKLKKAKESREQYEKLLSGKNANKGSQ